MKKLRVAIAGLGRIASLLEDDAKREKPCTHAGAIVLNPECELVAGADIDPERCAQFAERWKVEHVYGSLEALLASGVPDILHVATHPDSHRYLVEAAVKAGVKTIVCEKPLTDNLRDAKFLASLHTSGKATILTNHERRYAADWNQARDILFSGKLGALLSANATLYMGKSRRLLDVLWHDGTHLADISMYMTGAVLEHRHTVGKLNAREGTVWLHGRLKPRQTRDDRPTTLLPGFSKPVPFVLEIGAGRDHLVFELCLSCEFGRLRIGNGVWQIEESVESPYAEGFRSLAPTSDHFEGLIAYFTNMVADAVACARTPGRTPRSSALDGLDVIRYLQTATHGWR